MKYSHISFISFLLFLILGTGGAFANNNYYARVTATAIGPTGAGTVYAESNSSNGTQGTTSTATGYTITPYSKIDL